MVRVIRVRVIGVRVRFRAEVGRRTGEHAGPLVLLRVRVRVRVIRVRIMVRV